MVDSVKPPAGQPAKRRYVSSRRQEQAAGTRRDVLNAAATLFATQGYVATSVGEIAERAGVAVDTVYASAGRKPAIMRELFEAALSGADRAVPAEERDYVLRIRATSDARDKLRIYALAVAEIGQRLAPIHRALAEAATQDEACAQLRHDFSERRARNMRRFAAELRGTGELREGLSDADVADIVWSMNAAEYYALLVGERGWTSERFAAWLIDAWTRTLLA